MIASFTTPAHETPLSDADLHALHAYWRAANYLSVGRSTCSTTAGHPG